MSRRPMLATLAVAIALAAGGASAQNVLIRNATVHTAGPQGTLRNADVLVRNGTIAAVGPGLSASGVPVVDAGGKPLTPTLFGGIGAIGINEVSAEDPTTDQSLSLGQGKQMFVRPEFDVTLAYNPNSVLVPIARIDGIGFTMLAADPTSGGSIIGGQGAIVRLDGSPDPAGPKVLFITVGAGGANLSGNSRAGQWMLLDQLVDEVNGRIPQNAPMALLTPAGRATLGRFLSGGGTVAVEVHRAADIRQLLRWSREHNMRIAIVGGTEAWMVARELAAANVTVFVDPLANLPADFDQLGASLETAARLNAAGVKVSFIQPKDNSHNARKVRQSAGNAVANGLPWEAGLAGLTRVPAEAFGVSRTLGTIEVGKRADLVLWSGDPLEVSSVASQVWFDGKAIPMTSRQTELRDRYLRNPGELPRAYPPAGQ